MQKPSDTTRIAVNESKTLKSDPQAERFLVCICSYVRRARFCSQVSPNLPMFLADAQM